MLMLSSKSLGSAYLEVNKFLIDNSAILDGLDSIRATVNNLIIEVESSCSLPINLSEIGYTKRKWTHLKGVYVDMESLKEFKEDMQTTKSNAITFNFKEKSKKLGAKNGNCLLNLTLTRNNKENFNSVTVFWRATELDIHWAVDLILIEKIIEYLGISDTVEKITLHICSAFQAALYISPLLFTIWGYKETDLDPENCPYHKMIMENYKKYFSVEAVKNPTTWISTKRMQELIRDKRAGKKFPKWDSSVLQL